MLLRSAGRRRESPGAIDASGRASVPPSSRAPRHLAFLALLAAAVGLRLAVLWAYQPAFWYHGDSGSFLRAVTGPIELQPHRALGYVLLLRALRPSGSVIWVVALQHLLGLVTAVAAYIFLQRRRVPVVISCLAVSPLLFDGSLVTVGHYVLPDALYTAVLFVGVLVLLRRPAPSVLQCVAAGLLLAVAWFIKPLALPVVAIFAGYLLLRRLGWLRPAGLALAFLVPYLGVQIWIGDRPSPYGSNHIALYGRTAGIADCERLDLSPEARRICPAPDQRGHRPDWYAWATESPAYAYRNSGDGNPALRELALAVVRQQPAAYLRAVGRETAAHFLPGVDLGPEFGCLHGRYAMPTSADFADFDVRDCHPQLASPGFAPDAADPAHPTAPGLVTQVLAGYSRVVRLPQLLVTAVLLLAAVSLVAGGRGATWPDRRDAAMLGIASGAIIVLPVAVGMYEPRYALPALPLLSLAAGLSAHAMISRRRDTGG